MMQSIGEYQEVPKEDALVQPVGGLRKRHRGHNLAEEHHGQPKEWTQGNCGSWKKLAAASRNMTSHAGVARCKGRSPEGLPVGQGQQKNQTRNKFARGTRKGWTPGRRQLMHQEGANGMRNRDFREQLREENQRDLQEDHQRGDHETSSWNFQWVTKNDALYIVEESTTSKTEKETAHRAGTSNVEALATWDRLVPSVEKKREKNLDDSDTPGSIGTLSGSPSERADLKEGVVVVVGE
jgi:hypothetical protein